MDVGEVVGAALGRGVLVEPVAHQPHGTRRARCRSGMTGSSQEPRQVRRGRRRSSGRSGSPFAGRQCTVPSVHASRRRRILSTFMLASFGSSSVDAHERRPPLRAEVGLLVEEPVERVAVELGAGDELDRHHHPVADGIVGHGVHREAAHVGVAGDDRLDRRGGEVLAVDAQPLVRPAGEVEPAVGVAVGEVARPVPAVAEARLGRLLVLVVALEPARRLGLDDLADRLVEVRRPAVGRRTRPAGTPRPSPDRSPSPTRSPCRATRRASTDRDG